MNVLCGDGVCVDVEVDVVEGVHAWPADLHR